MNVIAWMGNNLRLVQSLRVEHTFRCRQLERPSMRLTQIRGLHARRTTSPRPAAQSDTFFSTGATEIGASPARVSTRSTVVLEAGIAQTRMRTSQRTLNSWQRRARHAFTTVRRSTGCSPPFESVAQVLGNYGTSNELAFARGAPDTPPIRAVPNHAIYRRWHRHSYAHGTGTGPLILASLDSSARGE